MLFTTMRNIRHTNTAADTETVNLTSKPCHRKYIVESVAHVVDRMNDSRQLACV